MQDYEQLGAFYLGRTVDPASGQTTDDLLLYNSRDLTTHAVCVGMTGSGKTGLGAALIEEAAIDGVPAIVIDPKGDLGNLLLTFPNLAAADFLPWVDPAEAARRGMTPADSAADTARAWTQGLAEWGQEPSRIARLRASAEFSLYTPGSNAGRPLSLLRSFEPPGAEIALDSSALRDHVASAVSGLLGLVGVAADPIQSREHILLSSLLTRAWQEGRGLDLAGIIQEVQKPPFDRVGVFDLESFYPARDRLALAMALNNLLAAPGFSAWMEGEPLDIGRLLYTQEGKPRISILSIAHLGDAERMFFVTLLLNHVVAWMRQQPGTGSLRAVLYMDEIFGFFPPTAVPPSKIPMLTLLKQARAFGLGVVLATQNPVDLDYKGLANTGTWFIGRLQTERDKQRLLDGLESASGGGTAGGRAELEQRLASLGNRVFLMHNVHDDQPTLFRTRWTLAYLRGPMTLPQIRALTAGQAAAAPAAAAPVPPAAPAPLVASLSSRAAPPVPAPAPQPPPSPSARPSARPAFPAGVPERFLRPAAANPSRYRPAVFGRCRLHFVDAGTDVDVWIPYLCAAPFSADAGEAAWEQSQVLGASAALDTEPVPGGTFEPAPASAQRAANYEDWAKTLKSHLYQNATLDLFRCPTAKLTSKPGESEGDFRARLALAVRERRDAEVARLERTYAPKVASVREQERKALARVERERSQYGQQKMQTAISIGATVLGALFGRRALSVGNVGRATTAMRGASRAARERQDIEQAAESLEAVRARMAALEQEFEREKAGLQGRFDASALPVEPLQIRPRKTDVSVAELGLLWMRE